MNARVQFWTVFSICAATLAFGAGADGFVNFETAPVHPIALSPDNRLLAVCNLPDDRIELFDVSTGIPRPIGDVPAGLDPVTVRFRATNELWVVNHISCSVSIINVANRRVIATIDTLSGPADVVFAGSPQRAFVSCSKANSVQVFDPTARQLLTEIPIDGDRPRAMAVSPDEGQVYVTVFESGNASTILAGAALRDPSGPYHGQMPPPNDGWTLQPPLYEHPNAPTDFYTDQQPDSLIVKRNATGRWMDDNNGDWTEFISGTNAALSGRPVGWDMPDRDLAIIDAGNYSISYVTGLMNICMAVSVNPASGAISVIGTDGTNERRFEPHLRGKFLRVTLAIVNPANSATTIRDLNPHLDYSTSSVPPAMRDRSIGDPRGIIWNSDGTRGFITGMGSRNLIVVDSAGARVTGGPIEVGEGPTGVALDEQRQRLYVWNRFSATLSVLDTATFGVVTNLILFDPTPAVIKAGRKHFYDTRRNSGLGQLACASCHVDGRMDRLAWDLGNPAAHAQLPTNAFIFFHPMKGPLVTQTLQDILGQEPLHWRGDRDGIEDFNVTFTDLLGADALLSGLEMQEFKDFLATIHFPPNRLRNFDNALPTNLPYGGNSVSITLLLTRATPNAEDICFWKAARVVIRTRPGEESPVMITLSGGRAAAHLK
jgi:YVTN family beta-propeller protein